MPTADQHEPGAGRWVAALVGLWGALWAVAGILVFVFGLVNSNAPELGGVAALLAIAVVAPMLLLFAALLMVCAVALWRRARWGLVLGAVLAVVQLAFALLLLSVPVWAPGLIGVATAGAALWQFSRSLRRS